MRKAIVFGAAAGVAAFLTCAFIAGTWDLQRWDRLFAAMFIWFAAAMGALLPTSPFLGDK